MTTKQPCPSGRYWKVKCGDTLYNIALRTATSVNKLLELNPNIDPKNLGVGNMICLPPEQPCPSSLFWIVADGDTLTEVARVSNTTVQKLLELNPTIDPKNLQIGAKVCLPS